LDKKAIAFHILAVGIVVAGAPAIKTLAQNIIGNPFTQTMIKDKVLALKL